MRMNLYVATCSLLAYSGLAFSLNEEQYDADIDLAQDYFDYDSAWDLAETYKGCEKK